MSSPTVEKILSVLKTLVDRNVHAHRRHDSGSSESYGYKVKKVVDLPEEVNAKCGGPTFLKAWRTHM